MTLLDIRNLYVKYGHVLALKGVSLKIQSGSVVALIGPNGAGKSTLIRCVMGLVEADAGEITVANVSASKLPPAQRVRLGIAMSPEGRRVFPDMTVGENLYMGAFTRTRRETAETLARVLERFPVLAERREQPAGTLSGGEQQMLSIGRALMSNPRILLLDEPSLGLAPMIVRKVGEVIRQLAIEDGLAVLLAEQNARLALGVSSEAHVLEQGAVVASGLSSEVANHDAVRTAYLGE